MEYNNYGTPKYGDSNTFSNITIISAAFNSDTGADATQYLHQEYDSNAKSQFYFKSGIGNWRYDSYLKGKLPKYKLTPN